MDQFAFDIAETAQALRRGFDRRAATLGVTRAQWRVLAWLAREEGVRQVDLAERLDVDPITLCRMVDRLSDADLVERRRDPLDRRAWRLHLTERARLLVDRLRTLGNDFVGAALEGVSDADRARVADTLARIRANLADAGSHGKEEVA